MNVASLLDREDAREERAHWVEPKQRAEVEAELAEIRRALEGLGFRRSA